MTKSPAPPRKRTPESLRSHRWLGVEDLRAFGHRSRMAQMGFMPEDYAGKPVIGILNTWSDLSPCHAHFRARAEEVKRGVWQAGGFPVEIPALPVTEQFMKPTSMLYRNLVERFFSKIKHFRAVATRYDKDPDNFVASVKLAALRVWLPVL